jgi:hypothetical protein
MRFPKNAVLKSVSFNSDLSCFICAIAPSADSKGGYSVFATSEFARLAWREFEEGGFGLAKLVDHVNIVLLVGLRRSPQGFSDKAVAFYDDARRKILWDVKLPSLVLSLECKRNLLVIAIDGNIFVYRIAPNFSNITFESSIATMPNPQGLCALSAGDTALQVTAPFRTRRITPQCPHRPPPPTKPPIRH